MFFALVTNAHTINQNKQTCQGLHVHKDFNKDDLRVWRNVVSNGWNEGDKGNHDAWNRTYTVAHVGILEKNPQIDDSQKPQGQENCS